MPIHEFKCTSCDHMFEMLIMNKDEIEELRCPKCMSPEVEKLMSAANVSVCPASAPASGGGEPSVQSHTCSSGSCTTFELPGHKK